MSYIRRIDTESGTIYGQTCLVGGRDPCRCRGIEVYFRCDTVDSQGNPTGSSCAELRWSPVAVSMAGVRMPCLFEFTDDEAQQLMDLLYEAGIRPTTAAGSAGQLAATQAHLEDMRQLVFKEKMLVISHPGPAIAGRFTPPLQNVTPPE